jgi:hypothetical protein
MKKYTKEQFMEKAGIKSRQRLNQIINGYKSKGSVIAPLLIEGKDFKKSEIIFFESALKKLTKH